MRKWPIGALFALGLFWGGCDMDVPSEEIASLGDKEFCRLTGGEYRTIINSETQVPEEYCFCGGKQCGKHVNCQINEDALDESSKYTCGGVGYTFLTEGPCTMIGVEVCTDRIGRDGVAVGYYTQCSENRWTEEKVCPSNYSCKLYMFRGFAMSSKCGDCQNDGNTCINGVIRSKK